MGRELPIFGALHFACMWVVYVCICHGYVHVYMQIGVYVCTRASWSQRSTSSIFLVILYLFFFLLRQGLPRNLELTSEETGWSKSSSDPPVSVPTLSTRVTDALHLPFT